MTLGEKYAASVETMDNVAISFASVSGLRPLASHVEFGFAPRTRASWRKRSFASAAWWPTTPVVAAVFIADVNTGSLSSDASHWKAASISLALPDPKASTIALSKEEGSKRGIVFTQAAVLEVHEPAAVGIRQPNAAAATFGLPRWTLRAMMRAKSKTKSRSPRANPHVDNYEREELFIRAIPQKHYFYFCFALVASGRARSLARNERSSAANAISHRTVRIPTTVPTSSSVTSTAPPHTYSST